MWALAALTAVAVVVQDQTPLRAAPQAAAPRQAMLWQGDWLEVRGEHKGYLKVWDHRRERPGYVRPWQVRSYPLDEQALPALGAVITFLADTPGAEALGIAHVALYLKAAPAGTDTAPALAALGGMADRLARRASTRSEAVLAAHLEVAASYGVRFTPIELASGTRLCYDGEAHRLLLALPTAAADARARAVLALTDLACTAPDLQPIAIEEVLRWRLALLDELPDAAPLLGNRLRLRRAALRAQAAYWAARRGEARATELGRGAWEDLARVDKGELAEDDLALLDETALRVAAARWSFTPPPPPSRLREVVLAPREPGETCVRVHDASAKGKPMLSERCTYGLVWPSSVMVSETGQVAIAVQPLPGWVEQWVFHQVDGAWQADVLPPSTDSPELGYTEVAGWSRDGSLYVVRESRGARRFQRLAADTLAVKKQARTAAGVPGFTSAQSPAWVGHTLALR